MGRLVFSWLAILVVPALLMGGGWAYFSDAETSSGNSFAAGTLDLKVADIDEGFADGVTATWVMNGMIPGTSTILATMDVQNSGTIAADHVEIAFSHTIDEGPDLESDTNWASTPGELARWLEIQTILYDGVNVKPLLADLNGNGWLDLEDVTLGSNAAEGGPLDNLPPPLPNSTGSISFPMSLFFRTEATNDIQGDTLTTTVTFSLNQDSSH